MKILVLHQVPYQKIRYHLAIDHEEHDVVYVGASTRISDIPAELQCRIIALDPAEDLIAGVIAAVDPSDRFEHVLALSEFGLLEAHALRRHLDLPGPTIEQLETVRDKVSMKRAVSTAGLLCPRFVDTASSAIEIEWSGRTVAKPRRGASSDGVRIFDTPDEAIAHLSTLDDPAGHQLEEFVEGPLLHADALVVEGIPQHATVSTYSGRPVDFPAGVPLGSTQVPVSGDHLDYIAAVVAALGITVGALHLEFFDTDRGFVFLEAANRVGGGGIIEAHRLHTGIHLPTHEIRVRLGLAALAAEPASGSYHAFVMFPPPDRSPGELVAVVPDDLARHPFVRAMHINTARPQTNSDTTYQEWEVPLFVEAEHRSSEELLGFVDDLLTRVRIDRRVAA